MQLIEEASNSECEECKGEWLVLIAVFVIKWFVIFEFWVGNSYPCDVFENVSDSPRNDFVVCGLVID